ncbi:monothiol glutaredoxin-S9 [Arachis duranensis]|uniref:Monothiol glutaredoxin-S9 n=1 Tax=Arachis duranensis TaxID=130453 RepID=A0A6P4CMS0_ARADU|nr:monothiol glutaredoxin-S9 [Arachis duranensis]
MQQAIPYRSWRIDPHTTTTTTTHFTTPPPHSESRDTNKKKKSKMVERIVLENAVIVFGRRGCCMSHVVKRLLLGLGVNPVVHEVEENDEEGVDGELQAAVITANNKNNEDYSDEGYFRNSSNNNNNNKVQFPAVFIGGKFFGGLDRIMATHISGELVPILKQAGALWL